MVDKVDAKFKHALDWLALFLGQHPEHFGLAHDRNVVRVLHQQLFHEVVRNLGVI